AADDGRHDAVAVFGVFDVVSEDLVRVLAEFVFPFVVVVVVATATTTARCARHRTAARGGGVGGAGGGCTSAGHWAFGCAGFGAGGAPCCGAFAAAGGITGGTWSRRGAARARGTAVSTAPETGAGCFATHVAEIATAWWHRGGTTGTRR